MEGLAVVSAHGVQGAAVAAHQGQAVLLIAAVDNHAVGGVDTGNDHLPAVCHDGVAHLQLGDLRRVVQLIAANLHVQSHLAALGVQGGGVKGHRQRGIGDAVHVDAVGQGLHPQRLAAGGIVGIAAVGRGIGIAAARQRQRQAQGQQKCKSFFHGSNLLFRCISSICAPVTDSPGAEAILSPPRAKNKRRGKRFADCS